MSGILCMYMLAMRRWETESEAPHSAALARTFNSFLEAEAMVQNLIKEIDTMSPASQGLLDVFLRDMFTTSEEIFVS